ncbi:MAG: hypothetical protein CSA13_02285 [Clostridiales bacterium]|nr:MAG: hypothetical protein CSA13_02285 [Clostridiales bacterium]
MRQNRKHITAIPILLTAVIIISGCVSAGKMLNNAQKAWAGGEYARSVTLAMDSYETALKRSSKETLEAKTFLLEHFSEANRLLSDIAIARLNGNNFDKARAWETYQSLVDINRRASGSPVFLFLQVEDFTSELREAKNVAAELKYAEALELMNEDSRQSCIKAASLLDAVIRLIPNYKDSTELRRNCISRATLTVALTNKELSVDIRNSQVTQAPQITEEVLKSLKNHIREHDYPNFIRFVSADNLLSARQLGAVLFVDLQSDLWVKSDIWDSYTQSGSIRWKRSWGGNAQVTVTRIADNRSGEAMARPSLEQEINIEFYPKKYNTQQIPLNMYLNQFNNASWTAGQLHKALNAVKQENSYAEMTLWAGMEYGGRAFFLPSAQVLTPKGLKEMPISPDVWENTEVFVNSTLPDFLRFSDLNISRKISREIIQSCKNSSEILFLLENLEAG